MHLQSWGVADEAEAVRRALPAWKVSPAVPGQGEVSKLARKLKHRVARTSINQRAQPQKAPLVNAAQSCCCLVEHSCSVLAKNEGRKQGLKVVFQPSHRMADNFACSSRQSLPQADDHNLQTQNTVHWASICTGLVCNKQRQ